MPFKTFATGSVLTAAEANDYLMEQAVIACTSGTRPGSPNEGMTIFETDTDYLRIYNGSAWRLVRGDTPAASVDRTTSQTIGTGSATAVSFNAELFDHGGCWDIGSPTRLTAPIAGVYMVSTTISFSAEPTGNRQVHIYTNGSEHSRITVPSIGDGLATRVSHSAIVRLAAGGYVEIFVFQDSGGNVLVPGGGNLPNAAFTWIREGA